MNTITVTAQQLAFEANRPYALLSENVRHLKDLMYLATDPQPHDEEQAKNLQQMKQDYAGWKHVFKPETKEYIILMP